MEGNDTGAITVATFTTPDLNSQAGDFTAMVSWGDGTTDIASVSDGNGSFTVTDDHTYEEKGSFPVSVTITDAAGVSTAVSSTATVTDAPLTLTGGFQLGDALSNPPNSFTVASFTDANPNAQASDYTVNINWGDGNSSSGNYVQSAGDGTFLIVAPHNYTLPFGTPGPLTRTVTVTLTDVDGASASTTSTVVVGQLQAGVPVTMGELQFMDANTYAKASDFVAQGQTGVAIINWGDGTSSLGTVSGGPGNGSGPQPFYITGVHTYGDSLDQPNGQYAVTATVTDVDGNILTGTQYVSVVRPPVTGNVNEIVDQPGVPLNNVQVAEFTVPDAVDGPSEFSAVIHWADGTTSSGTIQELSPGLVEVLGSHTFTSGTWSVVEVDISQNWSNSKLAAKLLPPALPYQITGLSMTMPGGPFVLVDAGDQNGFADPKNKKENLLGIDGELHTPTAKGTIIGIPKERDFEVTNPTTYQNKLLLPVNITVTGGNGDLTPGIIRLSIVEGKTGGQVRLWSDQNKTRRIEPGDYSDSAFQSLIGHQIYVEGINESADPGRDVQLVLSYFPDDSPAANVKSTKITTLNLTVTPVVTKFAIPTRKVDFANALKAQAGLFVPNDAWPNTSGYGMGNAYFSATVITNRGDPTKVFYIQDYKGADNKLQGNLGALTQNPKIWTSQSWLDNPPRRLPAALAQALFGGKAPNPPPIPPAVNLPWLDVAAIPQTPTPYYTGLFREATRQQRTTLTAEDHPFLPLPDTVGALGVPPYQEVNVAYRFTTYVVYQFKDGSIRTEAALEWTVVYHGTRNNVNGFVRNFAPLTLANDAKTSGTANLLSHDDPVTIFAGDPAVPPPQNAIANVQMRVRMLWK